MPFVNEVVSCLKLLPYSIRASRLGRGDWPLHNTSIGMMHYLGYLICGLTLTRQEDDVECRVGRLASWLPRGGDLESH